MDKSEVEYVLITVKSGVEEALNIKIYKNGILARRGCGGLPGVTISGMSFTGDASYFDQLMQSVSQQILDENINHEEEIKTGSLEYLVAFYGVSANGDQGERAEWTKSTGLRFFMDEGTSFRHNLLGFADGFAIEAMKLTNSWYFDIVMLALEKMRSDALPEQTLVNAPKTDEALNKDFQSYFEQISKKELPEFIKNKSYTDDSGQPHQLSLEIEGQSISYKFGARVH
ncbi:hypothetical protein SAMN06265348_11455 [Pedobacter westerhofensis]|uniref:Uncharacterized protein n=1 Tax=Pedobacter westerhofensis TaxID=425512 RepID=A0A521FMP9_9SPHI|nr:hypothetical protein [Pedobacter westerhofensis]SMO97442.1 hypothetical protein SAMN06265348_11455 [Pedobacter westerhofensis]